MLESKGRGRRKGSGKREGEIEQVVAAITSEGRAQGLAGIPEKALSSLVSSVQIKTPTRTYQIGKNRV